MNRYQIIMLPLAEKKIEDIEFYIAYNLGSPLTASRIVLELLKGISSLEDNPNRSPVYEKTNLVSEDKIIRQLIVKN